MKNQKKTVIGAVIALALPAVNPRPAAAQTAATPAATSSTAEPGAELTVHLMTMGPGSQVWEKFGHNAIWIHDAAANTDIAYHWGLFDFADEDFLPNFLKGRMLYSMGAFDLSATIDAYRQANRTVWAQELDMTPAQRHRLARFVAWNLRPENRKYLYDYYRDNCSTRIRDALDNALGGSIKLNFAGSARDTSPTPSSYRFHTGRLTQDDWPIYTGTMLGLGQPVDRQISPWEEMFLPVRMMIHLRGMNVSGAAGQQALVTSERVLFQATRPAEPVSVTRGIGGYLALAASVLALGGILLVSRQRSNRSLAPVVVLAAVWSVVAGILGSGLAGLWVLTNHIYSYRNENLFQANPLSLVLAVVLIHLIWTLRSRSADAGSIPPGNTAALLAGVVALISLAGFVMQVAPGLDQVNGGIIALMLPVHVGIASFLFRYFRKQQQQPLPQRHGDTENGKKMGNYT